MPRRFVFAALVTLARENTVFAYLVLRLADRGEFGLDRPLYEMLEYPRLAHDGRYKRITARIVLSHGTGLPHWGGEKKGATSPESSLTPIAEDLFEVDADPTLRIRFVGDGAGPAVKLIGLYSGGTMDEWPGSQLINTAAAMNRSCAECTSLRHPDAGHSPREG